MIDIAEINKFSWQLAIASMAPIGNKTIPFSTSQIQKIMSASKVSDNMDQIKKLIDNYEPAPPQNKKPSYSQREIRIKRDKNNEFGKLLLQLINGHDIKYIQQLIKYTIWNIKIIENIETYSNNFDQLRLIMECEGIKDKEVITRLDKLNNTQYDKNQNFKKNSQTKRSFRRNY